MKDNIQEQQLRLNQHPIRVTFEYEHSVSTVTGEEAARLVRMINELAASAQNRGNNPFEVKPIQWASTPKEIVHPATGELRRW